MKIKKYKEKETVAITLTKEEAWDLMMVCHTATIYHEQELRKWKKDSEYWKIHQDGLDKAIYFEHFLNSERFTNEIEEVEL
jgi:hypothetical protein